MPQDARPRLKGNSGETFTVGCKLPNGLILRLFEMKESAEPMMGGGYRTIRKAEPLPEEIFINGNSHPQNRGPNCQMAAGAALTIGVKKEFWERWLEANKDAMYVRNGLIFAYERTEDAIAYAEEHVGVVSNLERLDPEKLPKGLQKSDLMKSTEMRG